MRAQPENSPGLVGVHSPCKSHRIQEQVTWNKVLLKLWLASGVVASPQARDAEAGPVRAVAPARQVELNPGLGTNGSCCTHTSPKVWVNKSVAVRLWVLELVPVWMEDAQMLGLGKATGKDQGLPQYGTKLLYSASLP